MPDDQKNDQTAGQGQNDNGQGAGENNDNSAAGQGTDKGADTTDTGNEDAGAGEGDEGGEGTKKDASQEGQNNNAKAPDDKGKKTQKEEGNEGDDNAEPEVRKRKSPQDFIIQRQQKKLAKFKSGDQKNDAGDNEDAEDDGEIAPEDEELITKVVSKQFAPIIEKSLAAEDEQEIQDFLKTNPDFKQFEAKARKFMQHPSRRQLPVKSIFYEVAGDQLLRIGAERANKANDKAKQTQTGGGSNRGGEGVKGVWEMSKNEFEAKQEEIRRKQA